MTRMKEHGKITERQFAGIIANTLIGIGILIIPRTATEDAGTAAWLSLILGAVVALLLIFLFIKLGKRFPKETLIEYGPRILGRWGGGVVSLLLCFYWFVTSSMVLRLFAEVLASAILKRTPLEMIVLAMLFVVVYFIRHDLQVFARINELYFLFILIPAVMGIVLSMRKLSVVRLMPLMGGNGLGVIISGAANLFLSFIGFEIIVLLIPSLVTQEKAYNYGFKGWLSPALVYLAIIVTATGVFGIEELQNLVWPTLELAKVTQFPGLVLERVEAIFLAFWLIAVFTTVSNLLYSSIVGLTQFFKLEEHKTLIYPLIPFSFIISMYPENVYNVFESLNFLGRSGGLLVVITPVVIYLVAIVRKVKGDEKL